MIPALVMLPDHNKFEMEKIPSEPEPESSIFEGFMLFLVGMVKCFRILIG